MMKYGVCILAGLLTCVAPVSAEPESACAPGEIHTKDHIEKSSLQDVSRQANNPVSTVWTLQNQFDILTIDDVPRGGGGEADDKVSFTWNMQPVLPIHLTKEWNLLNRAVIPLVDSVPLTDRSGGTKRTTGFGDIVLASVIAPNKAGGLLWGAGTTWQFDTATTKATGTQQWSVGPAAFLGWIGKDWLFGAFHQQWWSFGGSDRRDNVASLDTQYFLWRLFPGGWQVGFTQDIKANFKAKGSNVWTVPVGIGAGKTFAVGGGHFKLDGQISYALAHPDEAGQRLGFRIRFTPILPALCCAGTLFE
jgi:hypothetical protein